MIDNITPLVSGNYQDAYISDNSGTQSLSNATTAGSQFVYDGS